MKFIFLIIPLLIALCITACKKTPEDPAPTSSNTAEVFAGPPQDPYGQIPINLDNPRGLARDGAGNFYVADCDNHRILKIAADSSVTILAGGTLGHADGNGNDASFAYPKGLAVDASGNVYVADEENNRIRRITPEGTVTTLAGSGVVGADNGTGTAASFNQPTGVAVDTDGNVFVTDQLNSQIRKITPTGVVTTFAGSGNIGSDNGIGTAASFNVPYAITIDATNTLFVTDTGNHLIRRITPDAQVSTAIDEQTVGVNTFEVPTAIAADNEGNLYVSDIFKWVIRKIDAQAHPAIFYGSERGAQTFNTLIRENYGMVNTESYVFVTDALSNRVIRISK